MSLYTDGVPDDLEATHVVVGTGGYYTAMPYQNTRQWVAVVIAVMVVFVILLIGFSFWWNSGAGIKDDNSVPLVRTPPPLKSPLFLTAGRGVSQTAPYKSHYDGTAITTQTACDAQPESHWNIKCFCYPPYWGGDCLRESYKPQYIPLGDIPPTGIVTVPIDVTTTTNLSYLSTNNPSGEVLSSCTDLCDSESDCLGVVWDAASLQCTTLAEMTVKSQQKIVINPTQDSNVYVKNSLWQRVVLEDRILVYKGVARAEWWLRTNEQSGLFLIVRRGMITFLPFYPQAQHGQGLLYAVYSLQPFDPADFDALVNQGSTDTVYVFKPGDTFWVPVGWADSPIWCMYDFHS